MTARGQSQYFAQMKYKQYKKSSRAVNSTAIIHRQCLAVTPKASILPPLPAPTERMMSGEDEELVRSGKGCAWGASGQEDALSWGVITPRAGFA